MVADLENPPPVEWPAVLRAWFRASSERDADGWRACLADDARSLGPDGSVTVGADVIVAGLALYYGSLDPHEVVDAWIAADDGTTFVWHGTVAPETEHSTPFCTVCTVRDDKIVGLRFFADAGRLAQLPPRS